MKDNLHTQSRERHRLLCGDAAIVTTAELMLLDAIAESAEMSDSAASYWSWVRKQKVPRSIELSAELVSLFELHEGRIETARQRIKPDREPQGERPAHYGGADDPFEAIKVIEAWHANFNLGNTLKYISRHRHKGEPLRDQKKARFYLDREIAAMEQRGSAQGCPQDPTQPQPPTQGATS